MAAVVRMPEVLTGITEAAIQVWLVEPGQAIVVGTPLAEVETEKAVVEYAAEIEGTVLQLLAPAGASVPIGDPIAVIGAPGESIDGIVPTTPAAAQAPGAQAAPPASGAARAADSAPGAAVTIGDATTVVASPSDAVASGAAPAPVAGRRFVSPLVRRLARERGIDLDRIEGTGPNGRVVRRDLDALASAPAPAVAVAVAASAPAAQLAPASASAAIEAVPLTGMRRAIARRLTESTSTVPHFYLVADCRVDRLLALRAEINAAGGPKISVNDLVLKAVAGAMREVPEANATWGETVIHRYASVDIAVAVAIDGGLVTPVVRDVDRLTVGGIAAAVADLAARAREGRLKQHELEGGTFSVSNLGMYGTAEFSAIINPPHSGILAVGAARSVPVVEDGALAVGTVMTVTLSADHRVVDGALAAQWLAAFQRRIESPLSMLV